MDILKFISVSVFSILFFATMKVQARPGDCRQLSPAEGKEFWTAYSEFVTGNALLGMQRIHHNLDQCQNKAYGRVFPCKVRCTWALKTDASEPESSPKCWQCEMEPDAFTK